VSVMAYHSFDGEVEASDIPTIRRLTPSCRHQLSPIARDHITKPLQSRGLKVPRGRNGGQSLLGILPIEKIEILTRRGSYAGRWMGAQSRSERIGHAPLVIAPELVIEIVLQGP
jgi:hypothetical protein